MLSQIKSNYSAKKQDFSLHKTDDRPVAVKPLGLGHLNRRFAISPSSLLSFVSLFFRRPVQSFDRIPAPSEKCNNINGWTSIDFGNHIANKPLRTTLKLKPDNADI